MRENEKQMREQVKETEVLQDQERSRERDRMHFEFLMLEILQCGLNWRMILGKREIIRACFDQFDYYKIACYDAAKTESILKTEGMIKNRRKVQAIAANAAPFIRIIEECGSFDSYIRKLSENHVSEESDSEESVSEENVSESSHNRPFRNDLSDRISRDLKRRGLKYIGTITVYSYLQACGIISDENRISYLKRDYRMI